jgi:LPXTG-motif cell wall-anchored protein
MKFLPLGFGAIAATTSLILAPVSSAFAAGMAPLGSTITATAWERGGLDDFSYVYVADGVPTTTVTPADGFEEYVYRIHDGSESVDIQSSAGYDSLTEAEQYEWYEDAGYAPYEFNWIAFSCLADSDFASTETLISGEITLTKMHYVAADSVFPSDGRLYFENYLNSFRTSLLDGTAFLDEGYIPGHSTRTGYPGVVNTEGPTSVGDMAFSASYPEFECAGDSQPYGFRILDSADIVDTATERDLEIAGTLHIDAFGYARQLEADGVFIGVTGGGGSLSYNAALWGMTQVGDEQLADTGASTATIAGVAAVGSTLIALGGIVWVLRRRNAKA